MKYLVTILIISFLGLTITPAGRSLIGMEGRRGPSTEAPIAETGNYTKELAAADNVLRSSLFDYGSARINWDYKLVNGTLTVRVNAKNQFGGYTGFKTYVFKHGIIQ